MAYLSGYRYMPYRWTRVLPKDLFGISLSEGTVDNMLKSAAHQGLFIYGTIQKRPQKEGVGGGDEAGARIEGGKGRFHTWQSTNMTFVAASMDRGFKTVPRYFPNGFPSAVYVSDRWVAQPRVPAFLHRLCIAHLLRELKDFEEALQCKWSEGMKALLCEAIEKKKQLTAGDYRTAPLSVKEP